MVTSIFVKTECLYIFIIYMINLIFIKSLIFKESFYQKIKSIKVFLNCQDLQESTFHTRFSR